MGMLAQRGETQDLMLARRFEAQEVKTRVGCTAIAIGAIPGDGDLDPRFDLSRPQLPHETATRGVRVPPRARFWG